MNREKRLGLQPIPNNWKQCLNELQMLALNRIENFGWQLHFVRRQTLNHVIPVVINQANQKVAVLSDDGDLDLDSNLQIRA